MGFKKIAAFFLLISTTALAQVTDPVLMRVNGKEVRRSEFEYAFNKNNSNLAGEGQTVEEYLPMYVDFKLKVAEAEALKLDTLSSLKEEYARDRSLMAENYLVDTCFINDEAYKIYAKDSATIGCDGFVEVAHIVFLAKQNAPSADIQLAKARIDSAYVMLNEGKTFEDIAQHFKIPAQAIRSFEIIRSQVYPEFEQVAYSLADGSYSAPFESPAGYHIVKRISSRPFGSFAEYKPNIIKMLEQQNIREKARIKRGADLAREFGGNITPKEALALEDSLLESKYPEFGNLMREYYEGLLFFEVSTREVWNKVAEDEAGLVKFFKKNKKDYKFETPRFRGAVVQANSQENLDNMKSILNGQSHDNYKAAIEANLPKDSARTVRVEIGVFAIGDNAFVDKMVFGQGDGGKLRRGFVVVDTIGKVIEKPETYKDVKGLVTADYQKYLEEKWLKSLRKKYKVKIDKDVLKTVNNHD
ncbi:MAG: peptidylprolyl isomerase [Bacteroidaceae bacterium]|nr:peptidylprolyl isomerase [Bacteroidaceae bacterium]